MKKDSAATKRAKKRGYFENGPDWFCEFKFHEINGLGYEKGITRRDPSAVIEVDGVYYTYYTKSVGDYVGFGSGDDTAKVWPWDYSDIWYATSNDGENWAEQEMVIARGESGSFDDRSVFTPEILAHDNKYYLVYQAVKHPYKRRSKNTIAMAVSDNPAGPFKKLEAPILAPSDTGIWDGDEDNRFLVKKKGDFDSHKVHDPVLFHFKNKFYLYYKGEPMGEEMFMGGRETKWGVAISEHPQGPYIKSEYNPVSNSGHETLLWQYKGGMAALLSTDGAEKNTVQFAKDGINFEIMAYLKNAPEAAGPFRGSDTNQKLNGLNWGLCHNINKDWDYICGYKIDTTLKDYFINRHTYE